MSKDEQDDEILSALVVEDKMTAYALCKETGISVPQINFRIVKLISTGVVKQNVEKDKTSYSIHPVLKSKEAIAEIAAYIKNIFDIVDETEETSIDGIKAIIGFILSKTDIDVELTPVSFSETAIEEPTPDDDLVSDFMIDLKSYAEKHNLKIMNVKGWTNNKIKWMALNNRKCACAPDKRVCPCPEGLKEIEVIGNCKCSVFARG